jgi:tetratricopeptide (TPR) repeat protein
MSSSNRLRKGHFMRTFRRGGLWLAGFAVLLGLSTLIAARWYRGTRPEYRLERGREALRHGEWDQAERLALVLDAEGAHDHALLLRAETTFARARPYLDSSQQATAAPWLQRTLQMCNQIRDQDAVHLEAVALAGKCLLYLGEPAQAERAFDFVVHKRPDHADAHRSLAAIYYDQGALLRALQHLQEVAHLDPRDGRPHRMMGDIYKQLGRDGQAIDCFQEALRRTLGRAFADEAREDLAECLLKQSRYAEALQVLNECDAQAAPSPRRLAWRAECLYAQGQTAEARTLLDRALADHPAAAELLRLRARLHQDAHELEAAAALLVRVVALDRHDYPGRYQLVLTYERLGRADEAAEQHRLCQQTKNYLAEMERLKMEAINRPWEAAVRRRLAELCRKLDQPEQARMWLRAAEACAAAQTDKPIHGELLSRDGPR